MAPLEWLLKRSGNRNLNGHVYCSLDMSLGKKIRSFLGGLKHQFLAHQSRKCCLSSAPSPDANTLMGGWPASLHNPTSYYGDCFRFFHAKLDPVLVEHRRYFQEERRGFGEDAFHVMWWMLFQRFHFRNYLEIGVYRGQTLSLASLLQSQHGLVNRVTGISPFLPSGDAVSTYCQDIHYLEDTQKNFRHFALPEPELIRAYSTDTEAVAHIRSRKWDAIYIDGNHDYEVARQDWDHCSAAVAVGGIIVLDDSGLSTSYSPPRFSTGGHPGPSQLASEIDREKFVEILQVGHNRIFQRAT